MHRFVLITGNLRNFLVMSTFFYFTHVSAHHSFATHYITNELFEISGVVTDVQLRMPHSFYYLDVELGNGTIEQWEIEAQSIILLRRMGINAGTLGIGDEVQVSGMRSRDPDRYVMFANEFLLESGERHVMYTLHDDSTPQDSETYLADEDRSSLNPSDAPLLQRISGVWMRRSAGPEDVFNRGGNSPMPLNRAGLTGRATYDPTNASAIDCKAPNFPALLYAPYLIRIQSFNKWLIIDHEYYQVRRDISLTADHESGRSSTEFGYSTGRVDAGVLVIETDNFEDHPAGRASDWDGNGRGADIPGSSSKRLREEYTVSANNQFLYLDLTVQDSLYLTEPYRAKRLWERAGAEVIFETDVCDLEISRRSTINATGTAID